MKLVEETNIILRQKCDPFDFNEPIMDPYELSEGLQKIRKDGAGVGLAAPQVGINTQALVIGMGILKQREWKITIKSFLIPTYFQFQMNKYI